MGREGTGRSLLVLTGSGSGGGGLFAGGQAYKEGAPATFTHNHQALPPALCPTKWNSSHKMGPSLN